ncbi:MAG: hypothetical protein KAV00_03230 [Phycisphaerae bacterium]|nr:hypothetical protein [Phycisphaerae bacterium]
MKIRNSGAGVKERIEQMDRETARRDVSRWCPITRTGKPRHSQGARNDHRAEKGTRSIET